MSRRDSDARKRHEPPEDWETANYELDRSFLAAMNCKDLDGAMSCFLDNSDLVVVLWGAEMRGPEPVRAAIANLFDNYDEVKLDIDRVTELPSGDAVVAVGQATYTLKKDGESTRVTEIWTDLRRKVNGRWVYVLDHAEVLPAK